MKFKLLFFSIDENIKSYKHTALLVISREFPNIVNFPPNFSPWWNNKMAGGDRNLFFFFKTMNNITHPLITARISS